MEAISEKIRYSLSYRIRGKALQSVPQTTAIAADFLLAKDLN